MKLRVLDIVLLVVIAVGVVFVWKTGQERSRLTAHYARLAAITGDLKITDPTKVHIQALETDDPMHFAWRMYYPPNYRQRIQSDGFGGSSWSSGSREFIGRVRFRMNRQGALECYTHFSGSSSRGSNVSGPLAKLLNDRWNELKIEQLGASGLTVLDPGETVSLLRITLPEDLQVQAAKALGAPMSRRSRSAFFELKLGPDTAKR